MLIHGRKGGSKQRTPVEAKDSLRSMAVARIVDLVSEGEIVGLVNGLKSVYLDETPIQNSDGSFNFDNVQVESRTGTPDQPYIKGFPSVENEIVAGVELRPDNPYTRQINNTALSAVRVRLSVPALSKANTETGDISGYTVSYVIELSTDDGPFRTILSSAFSGKTTSKYERSHRIDLPPAEEHWTLRVRRLTPMANSASIADSTYVESMTEIIDAKLRYPNSALVAIAIDAEQFQQIPRRSYHMKGRIIRVPTNYDPVNRIYTGLWDGQFKPAYSNNPAWIFYDLVTNQRYGLGHLVQESQVDKWSLYRIAQYCDQMVSDGKGGLEPRFTCNVFIQTQQDAYRLLMDLASTFRGITYWAAEQILTSADMPTDPVYVYTPANVVDGKFTYSGSARKARHTVAHVTWNDPADFYRQKVEPVESAEGIARYGINTLEVTLFGCTSQAQARRAGNWMLLTERYETDTVTFSVGLDGTLCQPGQIIKVMDPLRAGSRLGGRVSSANTTSVTVDFMPSPTPKAGDSISVVLPSGALQKRTIASVSGNTINVTAPFSAAPQPESAWVVESAELEAQLYRVLSVVENTDLTFTITALEHQPGKYAASETGVTLEERPTVPRLPPVVEGPSHVMLSSNERAGEVLASLVVTASWTAVPNATHYFIEWKRDDGSWTTPQRVTGLSSDLENAFPGAYMARVAAAHTNGVSAPTVSDVLVVGDHTTIPGVIEELQENLNQEILDRMAASMDLANQIASELAAEAAARAAALAALATSLQGEIDVIQAQLNDIMGAADWDPLVAYAVGDVVKHNGHLYRAKAAHTNQEPPNATYWEDLGAYSSLGDMVSALAVAVSDVETRVDDVEGDITALSNTVTSHGTRLNTAEGNIAAQSTAIGTLQTTTTSLSDTVATHTSQISGLQSTVSGKADSSALSALTTRVTDAENALSSHSTSLTNLSSRMTSAETTNDNQSTAISGLETRMTAAEGTITSHSDSITNLTNTIDHPTTGLGSKASSSALNALDSRVTAAEGSISSQSSSITALQNTLSRGGPGTNLLRNGGFEQYSSASSTPTNWTVSGNLTSVTQSKPSSDLPDSTNFARVQGTASSNANFYGYYQEVPVRVGVRYSAAYMIKGTNINRARLYMQWVDDSVNVIQTSQTPEIPIGSSWTKISLTDIPCPAGATACRIYLRGFATGAGTCTIDFDNAIFAESSIAVNYAPNAQDLHDVASSAITALDSRITSAEGSITSQASSISTLSSSVGAANASIAQIMQTAASAQTSSFLPLHNPGFEYDFGWCAYSGDGSTNDGDTLVAQSAYWTPSPHSGAKVMVFGYPDREVSSSRYNISRRFAIDSSKRMRFSIWNRVTQGPANTADLYCQLRWYDGNNAHISNTVVVDVDIVNRGWTKFQSGWVSPPSNAAYVRVLIGVQGSFTSGYCYVDDVTVEIETPAMAEVNAKAGLYLDVNGNISGYETTNDGVKSEFNILADKFRVVSSGSGARTEYSNGNWRVYDSSNKLRVRLGVW